MKIALFVHCFFPDHFYGTETYTLDLARNLRALGQDPIIVTAKFPGEPRNDELVSVYAYDDIPVYIIDKNHLPHTRIKDTYYQPEMRPVLQRVIRTIRPDIVHVTHLINHTAVLLEVAAELKIPTVATLTDFFGLCFNNKLEAADGTLCRGPNALRTNCLACLLKALGERPNAGVLQQLLGRHPISRLAAELWHIARKAPGMRTGRLAGTALDITMRPDMLRQLYASYRTVIAPTRFLRRAYEASGFSVPVRQVRFGIDCPRDAKRPKAEKDPIVFGFIGQIASHKGTDILVDAFKRVPQDKARLVVYGSGEQDPSYTRDLKTKSSKLSVAFGGTFPRTRMAQVLQEIDFLVIPSRWYENSPLVLLNALASHTPVIVSNVEGMTEFVEPGKQGYVFARENADQLAAIMNSIVENPRVLLEMRKATSYPRTTRMMTEEVLRIYEEIWGGKAQ